VPRCQSIGYDLLKTMSNLLQAGHMLPEKFDRSSHLNVVALVVRSSCHQNRLDFLPVIFTNLT
jgi:hypothetical protein